MSSNEHPFGEPVTNSWARAQSVGTLEDGRAIVRRTLRNTRGTEVVISDLGATIVSVHLEDRDGQSADVVLGFDTPMEYLGEKNQYFGCTVGRVANRIASGEFELGGETYQLATNNPPNHLHGGDRGFGARVWEALPDDAPGSVTYELVSEDGDEGYPGRVEARVTYELTEEDALVIQLTATTDAPTPISMTNHAYWNLAGHGSATVLDHQLEIRADAYTPTDETLIPTGEIEAVAGALDFRDAKAIGRDVVDLVETPALGYDHNYVLPAGGAESVAKNFADGRFDARLHDPGSGRTMELYTDQPGLQFYSGNFLFGQAGKGGASYALRSACCLEPQGLPNAINEPTFPSVVLQPGETYEHTTVLRFSVE